MFVQFVLCIVVCFTSQSDTAIATANWKNNFGSPSNTPKSAQNRSESLCAGLLIGCRIFWAWFGPAFGPILVRNRRFPAGFLKVFGALLAQPSLGPVCGQSWARDRYQRPRLEKRCINQPKLTRKTDYKAISLLTGNLKAIWPDLFGCVFEVWPAPGAREGLRKCGGLRPPQFRRLSRAPFRF